MTIKIAVFVKGEANTRRAGNAQGYFSYDVDSLSWDFFTAGEGTAVSTHILARDGYDVVVHLDGAPWCKYDGALPVVYLDIDSTLSEEHHRRPRQQQARQADLILVDHAPLKWFDDGHAPVVAFPYCVNDRLFHDYHLPRDVDVTFHCSSSSGPGGEQRKAVRQALHRVSAARGWRYRSGVMAVEDYAHALNGAKVCVNYARTHWNRPHRVFDAMAARTCLLTNPLPAVAGDLRTQDQHYVVYRDPGELEDILADLLNTGRWARIADEGYWLVMREHTWAVRAAQLRRILIEHFPVLADKEGIRCKSFA